MALVNRIRATFGDPALAISVIALTIFGIAMIYSAGQIETPKPGVVGAWHQQILWLGISLVGMFVVMRVQVRWLEWIALPAYIVAVIALAATLIIGTGKGTATGTKSWLAIGPMMVQPSQFANLATILMLGRVMGSWRETPHCCSPFGNQSSSSLCPCCSCSSSPTWALRWSSPGCCSRRCIGRALRSRCCFF
jgi:cell division protein FtsW (lipid II flippase)